VDAQALQGAQEPKAAHRRQENPKPPPAALRTVACAYLAQVPVPHPEFLEPDAAREPQMVVAEHPTVVAKELP
jgi:hypothetical protein